MNKLIGITGVIGSGKSTVADIIKNMGYPVLSSDLIAKELINNNPNLRKKLTDLFGEKTYSDGKYNSEYISSIVFSEKDTGGKNLEKLNNAIHPYVIDELAEKSEELFKKGEKLVFNESALIFEAGLDDAYDYIINVYSPKETIIKRVMQRTGLNESQIMLRMKSQLSAEEKKRLSHFTVDNSGDIDTLKSSVIFTIELIKDLPAKNYNEIEMEWYLIFFFDNAGNKSNDIFWKLKKTIFSPKISYK